MIDDRIAALQQSFWDCSHLIFWSWYKQNLNRLSDYAGENY